MREGIAYKLKTKDGREYYARVKNGVCVVVATSNKAHKTFVERDKDKRMAKVLNLVKSHFEDDSAVIG